MSPGRRREQDGPDWLPLPPGPVGNGEFVPRASSADDRAVTRLVRDEIDRAAAHAGMDRRRFLLGAGGVAATMSAFNLTSCSSPGHSRPSATASTTTSSPGFAVPPPADVEACDHVLSSQGEFIFDVHTHHVMPQGPWRAGAPSTVGLIEHMLPAGCREADPLVCVDRAAYLHDLFLTSDTDVAMLSDVPNSGRADAPMPLTDAIHTQHAAAQVAGPGGAPRVLVQNVIAPNVGELHARLDEMTKAAATRQLSAFKVYTAWSPAGRGWSLVDPAIGLPVVQHAHDLGVRVLVAHKGLPLVNFDASHNGPDDLVAVSRLFPDMQFVVFHGAWDPGHREGPYDAQSPRGIDTFLAALDRHHVPPNDNVWVDLGTVWRQLLTDPVQAAHALGKLLTRVGGERVLWGTDAIWYGSPQPQIMAMRAFQIGRAYQEQFGYPELTTTVKARIFGLNAAHLFGVDPTAARCAVTSDPLTSHIPEVTQLQVEQAIPSPWIPRGPITRSQTEDWLASPATRWSPT